MSVNLYKWSGKSVDEFLHISQDLRECWAMLREIYCGDDATAAERAGVYELMKSGLEKEYMTKEKAVAFLDEALQFIGQYYQRSLLDAANEGMETKITEDDVIKAAATVHTYTEKRQRDVFNEVQKALQKFNVSVGSAGNDDDAFKGEADVGRRGGLGI